MQQETSLESVLKRDRSIIFVSLIFVTALSWAYMAYLAWNMRGMAEGMSAGAGDMAMSQVMYWGATDFIMTTVMWAVMMVAMMVPAAAPMVLLYAKVNRRREEQERPFVPTSVFVSGYFVVWWGFAIFATLAQWGLHQATLMSSMMGNVTPILGGSILIAAGVFQWTPLKNACLNHCRSPLDHIMAHWREGQRGALMMGINHGIYCLGCCWFLMALMFVAGVMNLVWMAGIAAYILLERVVPQGKMGTLVTWAAGAGMIIWGAWMIGAAII